MSQKTFLEIGSGDFDTLEYLSDIGWKGIVVEPIPKYFQNLRKRDNVYYLNAAVDWVKGEREMYVASEETVKDTNYTRGMSSFYARDHRLTEKVMVKTVTLEDLFRITNVQSIDFLKVDTEGFDAEIVRMFPFNKFKPLHLKIEKEHLSYEDLQSTLTLLSENGYHCEYTERDIFGFLVR
jgi:FkbM family methyltransferase